MFFIIAIGQYRLAHVEFEMHQNKIFRIIQPNISQEYKWSKEQLESHFLTLLELSVEDLQEGSEYIFVWPETSLPFHPEHNPKVMEKITPILDGKHKIITGKMRFQPRYDRSAYNFYNSVFVIDSEGLLHPFLIKFILCHLENICPYDLFYSFLDLIKLIIFSQVFLKGVVMHLSQLLKN